MDLFTLVVILIVAGVLMFVVNQYIPMDANIKKILNVVVLVAIVLWVINLFGVFRFLPHIRVGG